MGWNRILGIFILGIACLVGACTANDEMDHQSGKQILLTGKVQTTDKTRSSNQNLQSEWLSQGMKIGVFASTDIQNSSFILCGNNQMKTAGNGGALVGGTIYWPEESVYIRAYAPYNASWTGAGNQIFSLQTDQSTDEGYLQSDLLYGVPAVNPINKQSEPVSVGFVHKLSKINIDFTMTTDGPSLRGATVEILNVLSNINFDPSSGRLGAAIGNTTSIKIAEYSSGMTGNFTCSALVVPQTIASGSEFIRVTDINGIVYEYKINKETVFEEGNIYNYHVVLGAGEVISDNDMMDIYLCIGQSNMSGCSPITDSQKGEMPGVYLLNSDNKFEVAESPLNRYSTIDPPHQDGSYPLLGVSHSFSLKMAKQMNRKIGLVANAKGGSGIDTWLKGGTYYSEAVKQTKIALKSGGVLRGIIWHQGEANRGQAEAYKGKIKQLITDLRVDLKQPDLPVVVGQIGQWISDGAAFNTMILTVPSFIEHTACASTNDLQALDIWHFNTESILILGERYADAMMQLLKEK